MKILSFQIPKDLQGAFIYSLKQQFDKNGSLSRKQTWALKDILEIDEEFFNWDYVCSNERFSYDYNSMLVKLKKDRFRSVKTKNRCIRAMQSIIDEKPDTYMIDEVLGRIDFRGYRR